MSEFNVVFSIVEELGRVYQDRTLVGVESGSLVASLSP